jgi:hypothetical protein
MGPWMHTARPHLTTPVVQVQAWLVPEERRCLAGHAVGATCGGADRGVRCVAPLTKPPIRGMPPRRTRSATAL